MRKSILAITFLITMQSSYALEMHNATVLEHKSEISGRDDKGRAIDGHIESGQENIISESEKKAGEKLSADNVSKGTSSNISKKRDRTIEPR